MMSAVNLLSRWATPVDATRRALCRLMAAWAFWLFMAAVVPWGSLHAEPSASPRDIEKAVAYRRIFVPAGNVDAWPRDGEKYLPIESREFEALLAAANRDGMGSPTGVTITKATYSARLEGNRLVAGHGQWTIELHGPEPAFLPLHNLPLVVHQPRWRDQPDQTALLGAWGPSGGSATSRGLEVAHSGVLEFGWSAQMHSAQHGVEAAWRLPAATSTRLNLDLPAGKRPIIEGSVILDSVPLPVGAAAGGVLYRRWELALNPISTATLRIVDIDSDASEQSPDLSLSDDIAYRVTERGLEIVATLQIDDASSQLREVMLPLPRGMQLISASAAGQELVWRVVSRGPTAEANLLIGLPDPSPQPQTVTLQAWQPLVLGRPWQLPKLRPEGMFWSSGTIEISVAPSFELQRLVPEDCVQTGVVQSAEKGTGFETSWFTAYSAGAGLEITAAFRQPDVAARLGSSLAMGDSDANGRLVTQLTVAGGSLHTLSGELADGWIPEAVATIPADALGEWFLDRSGGRSLLELQLARAATPHREVAVIITGRLQVSASSAESRSGLARPLTRETLGMVRWRDVRVAEHFLAVETVEPYVVEPTGNLPIVAPESILPQQQALLEPAPPEGPVFDLGRASADAALRLAVKRPQFEADVWLDVTYADEALRQTYHVVGRPNANRIDRLLVYVTSGLGVQVQWSERSSGATLVADRLPADDPRRTNLPQNGEAWLVRLPRPTAKPVEIIATLTTPWSKRKLLPLVCVPEAVAQRGRVHVRGDAGKLPLLEPRGLRPIPLPAELDDSSPIDDQPAVRAAYRYEPALCQSATESPQLWLDPAAANGLVELAARRVELESFFMPHGRALHRTTYHLENQGAARFNLRLPVGAALRSVALNGRGLERSVDRRPDEPIPIPLDAESQSAQVSVHFETHQAPIAAGSSLLPPFVESDIPVYSSEWTIWLPEEFVATGAHVISISSSFNWRQRLFGPLGRPEGTRPFHPLRGGDWSELAGRLISSLRVPMVDDAPLDREAAGFAAAAESPPGGPDAKTPGNHDGTTAVHAVMKPTAQSSMEIASTDEAKLAGWQAYRAIAVAGGPTPVVVTHPPASIAVAIAVFLFCLVGGRSLWGRQRTMFIAVLAMMAAGSLLLPAAFAPVATGAFLGLVFSLVADWPRARPTEESPTKTWAQVTAVGATSVVLLLGLTSVSHGQSQDPALEPDRSAEIADPTARADRRPDMAKIHRLLIPADAEGHPTGTKYYVSEPFLTELLRSSNSRSNRQWVLLDAAYHGEFRERAEPLGVVAGDWTLTFTLEVLARDTTVVLPLVRSEAEWSATAALDGIPTPLQWRDDGRSCAVEVAEPGRYQLVIPCVPLNDEQGGRNRVQLTIPPVLGATIQLDFPSKLTDLQARGADLGRGTNDSPGMLRGELDGTPQLAVDWPRITPADGAEHGLRVTELSWVHVASDWIELETKYLVEGSARRPEGLTIAFDDQWELLSGDDQTLRDGKDGSRRGTIRVPFPPDDIDRQEVLLRWRLKTAGPLGNWRLPPIELTSMPVNQRWVAVSSDSQLTCEIIDEEDSPAGTANEFLALWGDDARSNQLLTVLANVQADSGRSLAVRPRSTESSIDDVLHLAAGNDGMRLHYQADVTPSGIHEYQFSLVVPDELTIDEITLTRAGRQIPSRWVRPAKDSVHVFFGQHVSDEYRVHLRGRVAASQNATYAVPRVAAMTDGTNQRLQLYRQEEVLVELRGLTGGQAAEESGLELPPAQWSGRPVAAYQFDRAAFEVARLVVMPNNPQTVGQTLTMVSREPDGWWATYTLKLAVEHGQLDSLRLAVPTSWSGPYEIESGNPSTTATLAVDKLRSLLLIHFADSLGAGERVQMRIRGRLTSEAAAPIAVPQIIPETRFRGRHFVLIPILLDGQPLIWTENGVRRRRLPREFRPPGALPFAWRAYEVTSTPFRVAQRPAVIDRPAAKVRLVDTAVAAGPLGGHLILTRMVLISESLAECVLKVPRGQELLSVALDGQPALIRQLDEDHWKLPLGGLQLPQFVEIVSRSTADVRPANRRVALDRPRLLSSGAPISVEMSLWSFGHPWSSSLRSIDGAAVITEIDRASLRLDRLVSIAESATSAVLEAPFPDGYNWYRPWAARLTALRQESLGTAAHSADSPAVAQVLSPAEEQITQASQRLDTWMEQCEEALAWPEPTLSSSTASEQAGLSGELGGPLTARNWIYCVAEGGAPQLTMELSAESATAGQLKIAGLLSILGLTVATLGLMRRPAAWDVVCRWPQAALFLIGVAYWAWLWPSWLGMILAAAGLGASFWTGWPGRSLRSEGSTVLRRER